MPLSSARPVPMHGVRVCTESNCALSTFALCRPCRVKSRLA
ncbi:hypothetical protein C4K26_2549 [Pseudomonas chlororaphis]|nr:hypothetical protein C4K26_2549 [Pseudomonas chlororaphis]